MFRIYVRVCTNTRDCGEYPNLRFPTDTAKIPIVSGGTLIKWPISSLRVCFPPCVCQADYRAVPHECFRPNKQALHKDSSCSLDCRIGRDERRPSSLAERELRRKRQLTPPALRNRSHPRETATAGTSVTRVILSKTEKADKERERRGVQTEFYGVHYGAPSCRRFASLTTFPSKLLSNNTFSGKHTYNSL